MVYAAASLSLSQKRADVAVQNMRYMEYRVVLFTFAAFSSIIKKEWNETEDFPRGRGRYG